MVFVPGHEYFTMTQDEYTEMLSVLSDLGLDFDLSTDFQLVEGNYYCEVSAVNADEYEFLETMGFLHDFNYKKSTQSTSPV